MPIISNPEAGSRKAAEKRQYHVCLWMPKDYPHSLGLFELAVLLRSSLLSNAIPCTLEVNKLHEDRRNVILGYHLMKFEASLTRYPYIPYQLEQLSRLQEQTKNTPSYFENIKSLLQHASAVWDYSPENIGFLKNLGRKAEYLPVGYHPFLEQITQQTQKDIDVLFYGSRDERRNRILEKMAKLPGIRTHYLFGSYGKERDAFVARSKMILNLHNQGTDQFEQVRIAYLLNNGCFVISEPSGFYPYPKVELTFASENELADHILFYLNHPDTMDELRNNNQAQFKQHYPMSTLLRNVL
jgi:hypothetical protein